MKKIIQILFWPTLFFIGFIYYSNKVPVLDLKNSSDPVLLKGVINKHDGSEFDATKEFQPWYYIKFENTIKLINSEAASCDGEYDDISLGIMGFNTLEYLRGKSVEIRGSIGCPRGLNIVERIDFSKNDGPLIKAEIDNSIKIEKELAIKRELDVAAIELGFSNHNDKIQFEKSGIATLDEWKFNNILKLYEMRVSRKTPLENATILGSSTLMRMRAFEDDGGLNTEPIWRGYYVSYIKSRFSSANKIKGFELRLFSEMWHGDVKTKTVTVNNVKNDLILECGDISNWRAFHLNSNTDIAESEIADCEISRATDGGLKIYINMKSF
jgi:hypothetical protein